MSVMYRLRLKIQKARAVRDEDDSRLTRASSGVAARRALKREIVRLRVAPHEAHEALPLARALEHEDRRQLRRPSLRKIDREVGAVQAALLVLQPQAGDEAIVPHVMQREDGRPLEFERRRASAAVARSR